MDGRKAIGPHIPIRRLVDVMLHRAPLSEAESDHLAHCPICMEDMTTAVRKEIGLDKRGGDGEDVA